MLSRRANSNATCSFARNDWQLLVTAFGLFLTAGEVAAQSQPEQTRCTAVGWRQRSPGTQSGSGRRLVAKILPVIKAGPPRSCNRSEDFAVAINTHDAGQSPPWFLEECNQLPTGKLIAAAALYLVGGITPR